MTKKYVRPAGGNSNAATTYELSPGGGEVTTVPTAADELACVAGSGNFAVNAALVCRQLDCNGYTGTMSGSGTIGIGDSTAPTSGIALRLVSGMTYTATGTISFLSTNASTHTIDFGGKTPVAITFNGTGATFQLASNVSMTGNWTWTAGTLDANGKSLTVTMAAPQFTGGGQTYGAATFTTTSGVTLTGNNAGNIFSALTITASAAGSISPSSSQTTTVTSLLTITGANAGAGRFLISSSIINSTTTVSAGSVSISNCDFKDVIATGTANWDLSAATGNSGNCGGNTGITFTTAATQTAANTTSFTWSTATWTSRVPLPQDPVLIPSLSSSQTVTIDCARIGASLDCTGSASVVLSKAANVTLFGSLTLPATPSFAGAGVMIFEWRTGGNTIRTAGRPLGTVQFTLATQILTQNAVHPVFSSGVIQTKGSA